MLLDTWNVAKKEWQRILERSRAKLILLVFVLWVAVPSAVAAVHRVAQRNIQAEANRQAWTLLRNYDIEAARWLQACPRALVTSAIIQLNVTSALTLFLAYDCVCGDPGLGRSCGATGRVAASRIVLGKTAALLALCCLGFVVAQSSACAVQSMAHGDFANAISWGGAIVALSSVFALNYVALWVLVSSSVGTSRRALAFGLGIGALLFVVRLVLRSRIQYPVLPSMLDTWLLSGHSALILMACAFSTVWSGACLFTAAACLDRRRPQSTG